MRKTSRNPRAPPSITCASCGISTAVATLCGSMYCVTKVMNEVKATPSLYDVEELIKRGRLLKFILASPDDYVTKPAEVKEKLEKCRDVRLALSGYNFQEQVQAQAWKKQMWVIRTNGEAFEARGPNSLSSHGS